MRKIILIFIMLIIAVLVGYVIYAGFNIGEFEIYSYSNIDKKSKELDELIKTYDDKNLYEVPNKQKMIEEKIVEYEGQKGQYEQLLEQKKNDLIQMDTANCYDVDFLWTKVGNYASQFGIDLEMNVSKSSLDQNKSEYILTDLSFTAIGDYEYITYFINHIETDEKLEFEIRDFNMKREKIKKDEKEEIVLKSTFKVYGVAINKGTLTNLNQNDASENKPNISNSTGANF